MSPVIVLVNPQMGENIGAAARAMLNCGLTDLRLVAPRDGWPNPAARANAAGADVVIEAARVFDTTAEAIADLSLVYATTARMHTLNLPVDTVEQATLRLRRHTGRCGVLFGPERTGLVGEDVARASRLLTIPLNPDFKSLNLGQAVLLVSYLWFQAGGVPDNDQSHRTKKTQPATGEELEGLIAHLTEAMDQSGFFTNPDKRPSMIRNLRAAFSRMEPTQQDVLTFRGIIKALGGKSGRPDAAAQDAPPR